MDGARQPQVGQPDRVFAHAGGFVAAGKLQGLTGLYPASRRRNPRGGSAAMSGDARGGFLPPLADLARLALQSVAAAPARHCHPLHDRRGAFRPKRRAPDEAVRRIARQCADGRGWPALSGGVPQWGAGGILIGRTP